MRNLLADRGTRLAAVLGLTAISVLGFNVAPAAATDSLVKFTTTVPQQCPTTAEPRNVCATMSGTWAPTAAGYSWDEIHPDTNGMGVRVCFKDMNSTYAFPTCWYPPQATTAWLTQTVNLSSFGQFTFPVSTGACNTTIFDSTRCKYFVQFRTASPSQADTVGTWSTRISYGSTALASADWVCPVAGGECVAVGGTLPVTPDPEVVPEGECGTLDIPCHLGKLGDTFKSIFVPDTDVLQTHVEDLQDAFMGSPLGAGVAMFRTWLTMCIPAEGNTVAQCWSSATPDKVLSIPQVNEAELAFSGLQQYGVMSYNYPNAATQPACVGPIFKLPIQSVFDDLGADAERVRAVYMEEGDSFAQNKLIAPFRACEGHTREVADMVRNLLTGVLYVGFAWFLANQIMAMVGIIGGMGVGAINANSSASARREAQTARESAQVGRSNKRADAKRAAAKAASDKKTLGW